MANLRIGCETGVSKQYVLAYYFNEITNTVFFNYYIF